MVLAQAEEQAGSRGRRMTQGRKNEENSSRPNQPDGLSLNQSENGAGHPVSGTHRIPVAFWAPDGCCFEGAVIRVSDEMVFVEASELVPVRSEITIRLRPMHDGEIEWGVATGIVLWQCPEGDHFRNRKGFGVCLQSLWPSPNGGVETAESKEVT